MPNNNTLSNNRIAKNTISLYIRMALVLLVSLYSSRVILNTLGVVDYGVYNVVAGFVSMFAFMNTSLTACIQRFYNYEGGLNGDEGFNRVYITSLFIQISLSLIVLVLSESLGLWYLNNKLVIPSERLDAASILFHCSVFSMVIVILEVPYSAAVMAKEHMGFYALIGIIDVVLKLVIVLILPILGGDSLIWYGFMLLIVSMIVFFFYYIYSKISFTAIRLRFVFFKTLFIDMIKFSGWSLFGSFAQIIRNQGLNIVLNLFFGPVVNAARGISYQVKTALSSFMANVPTAARPQLVEAYAVGNYERSKSIMFSISKICFILLYVMAIPIIWEMNYVLHLWLGDSVPEFTVVFSRIILIIAIVETFNWPVSMMIYATGDIGLYNILTGLAGILVLPFSYFVLKLGMAPVSVYIVSLLISILVQCISLLCLRKVAHITLVQYFHNVMLPCFTIVLASAYIPFIINLLLKESFFRLVVNCCVCIPIVLIVSYIIGLNRSEKDIAYGYVKSFLGRLNKQKRNG